MKQEKGSGTFEFVTDRRIHFGCGVFRQIGKLAKEFGQRALVVRGRSLSRAQPLLEQLDREGIAWRDIAVAGEPAIEQVDREVAGARSFEAKLVIGFGGGSVLDLAKAVAGLMHSDGTIFDYVEVVGRGRNLPQPGVPCIAVPTTAGTGSEVTRNAVLAVESKQVKVSLRSRFLLPEVALVDPELTLNLPQKITAFTGMDALTQVIEPYLSVRANPLTDALCQTGIARAAQSLQPAYEHGEKLEHREDMALASLIGGLALANAGLGAVHGLAAPLGGMFSAPHGAICAALLPAVLKANLQALRERLSESPALQRFTDLSRLLLRSNQASPEAGVLWVQELCRALEIPRLSAFGITRESIPAVVTRSRNASSMKANPVELTDQELTEILTSAI